MMSPTFLQRLSEIKSKTHLNLSAIVSQRYIYIHVYTIELPL
jgi:hypothetical protein